MKKILSITLGVAMFAGLVGCKKDYTCSCTLNYGSGDTTITLLYDGVKKADAEDGCAAAETTYKIADPNATCTLN